MNERVSTEHRALLARILGSEWFHKSARSRQLLEYLADHHFAGRGDAIHEARIGSELFERGADFDPSMDSIVRASMRQLRQRLAEYYAAEGANESWELQVPKGDYRLHFHLRGPDAAVVSGPKESLAATSVAPPPAVPAPTRWETWQPLRTAALRYGTFAMIVGAFFLGSWWQGQKPAPDAIVIASAAEPQHTILEQFLDDTQGSVFFVPSDSVVNLMNSFTGETVAFDDYRSRRAFALDHPLARRDLQHWETIVSRELLNIGDASLTLRAAREYPLHAQRMSFRQSRDLQARDLRNGNYVFLGSVNANPWVTIFEASLNFQFRKLKEGAPNRWLNVAPREGEWQWYPPIEDEDEQNSGRSYALVAAPDNLSRTGRVMLVGGISQPDTEAAGEFVLAPGSAHTLAAALGVTDLKEVAGFEVMLRTEQTGTTWRVSEVVAHRIHRTHISYAAERSTVPTTAR
ncbi:MAG: hypothetical protein KIT83_01360 [Bryobacterales bacterium]|nr:hypothetical protein [Bryobacterales bacterium]